MAGIRLAHFGVNVGNLLDRTTFTGAAVCSSHDTAVCTLTQLFDELVFRVDYESRVEGLKRVPLHHTL
jgi:hypothetical protein